MTKQEVIDLVEAKKAVASVPYDEIKAAVESIEVGGDVAALQAQIDALVAQVAQLQSDVAALQGKIDQIRAIVA